LVLTRKQGEQIRIGEDVVITVVRTKGKAVRLGIQAPSHVPVLRGEIAAAITAGEEEKAADEEREEQPRPGIKAELACCRN
jgi:carbon storage regulator